LGGTYQIRVRTATKGKGEKTEVGYKREEMVGKAEDRGGKSEKRDGKKKKKETS